jgi:hypothetical protein
MPASGLLAVKITGTVIPQLIHRRVFRFAQDDDGGASIEQ